MPEGKEPELTVKKQSAVSGIHEGASAAIVHILKLSLFCQRRRHYARADPARIAFNHMQINSICYDTVALLAGSTEIKTDHSVLAAFAMIPTRNLQVAPARIPARTILCMEVLFEDLALARHPSIQSTHKERH